jgi:hypothetical protein
MKNKICTLLLILVFSVIVVNGQNDNKKISPVGTWKFEAPSAPEGYTSGSIVVGFAERKYTASMVFTGNEYKFTGEKVKFENDSLFLSIFVQSQDVAISLKMEGISKMSGKAVYSEGEVPLSLIRATGTLDVKEKPKP